MLAVDSLNFDRTSLLKCLALEALPEAGRLAGFFNCWTRKEALSKAVGEGIFVSLNRFDVSLAPNEPARLVTLDGDTTGADSWHLYPLQPGRGMVGALATKPEAGSVRAWRLDLEHQHLPRPARYSTDSLDAE